jgi:zinc/manganese transport system ATP-binding protein
MGSRLGRRLALRDLIVTYQRVPAVHHVTGAFEPGSLTAIAGPNGAGKSTLLKAVMGFVPISDGAIDRDGLATHDIAYLPQAHEIDRSFPITVGDLVSLGFWGQTGMFGALSAAQRAQAAAALEAVGLASVAPVPIHRLSVGQFQRALFARLIVRDAPLVLLDEPFAGVDEKTTADLVALVKSWSAAGRTVVAVLHDLRQIEANFPQTLLLARECVAWGPTAQVLTPENLAKAAALTNAWTAEAARRQHDGHGHKHHEAPR